MNVVQYCYCVRFPLMLEPQHVTVAPKNASPTTRDYPRTQSRSQSTGISTVSSLPREAKRVADLGWDPGVQGWMKNHRRCGYACA